jgi:hypothetical protein
VVGSQQLTGGATAFSIAVPLLADADNHFLVTAVDGVNNESSPSDVPTITEDSTAPTATIIAAAGQGDPTTSQGIAFTVVFSEPVTGFTADDVQLGGTAGATTAVVTEGGLLDGTTYAVTVSGMAGPGTVIAAVAAGGAFDVAGNGNLASTSTDAEVTFRLALFAVGQGSGGAGQVRASTPPTCPSAWC